MIPHLRDLDCVCHLPLFWLMGDTLSLGIPRCSHLQYYECGPAVWGHTYIHTQHRYQCAFCWLFSSPVVAWLGMGTLFSHCCPSEWKTNRLIMDLKVCLLFQKGGTACVWHLNVPLVLPLSFPFLSSQSWVIKKKKLSCMLCVQVTEAESPFELFTVHNFRNCLKSLLPHTMNHLYFM